MYPIRVATPTRDFLFLEFTEKNFDAKDLGIHSNEFVVSILYIRTSMSRASGEIIYVSYFFGGFIDELLEKRPQINPFEVILGRIMSDSPAIEWYKL